MNEKLKNKPAALKVTRATEDRQFWVEGGSALDQTYVSFSGYFGSYGPCMFAAAPELLDVLERMTEFLEPMRFDRASDDAKALALGKVALAVIRKATGKTSEAA